METTLDQFGRIVIPKRIRDRLRLQAGDHLTINEDHDSIRLKIAANEPTLINKKGVLVFTGTAVDDISNAVQADRQARIKKFWR